MKALLLGVVRALGGFSLCRWWTRGDLRILCYHGIWMGGDPHYGDCLYMSAQRFEQRMALLKRRGYRVLALGEALALWEAGALPSRAVVITIDDAWYGTFKHMVPVLQRYAYPSTLYVTTYYVHAQRPVLSVLLGYLVARTPDLENASSRIASVIGESTLSGSDPGEVTERLLAYVEAFPDLEQRWQALVRVADVLAIELDPIVRDRRFGLMTEQELALAQETGMDLQIHTHRHRMYEMAEAPLVADLELNRASIGAINGRRSGTLVHFCYPSGVYGPAVFPVLKQAGIQSATTTEFGLNPRGTSRFALKRILDCESLSDIELEARLCGFWSLMQRLLKAA